MEWTRSRQTFHILQVSLRQSHLISSKHITGAICHGQKRVMCFIDLLQWKHDSNLTLNVLLNIFTNLIKNGGCLPECLHLQLDDCYRENKNRYIMAFSAYLIEMGIFKEIYISFLMVGHTHEDVDQVFSRIAVKLKRRNASTLPDLQNVIKEAYNPMPECQELKMLFDISGWIGEHVLPMKNHVYPHAFRFFMGEDKKAQMQYKNWATDATWLPRGEPFTILRSIPKGIPSLVRPILGRKEGMQLNDLLERLKQVRTE